MLKNENSIEKYDIETQKYIVFMCKKDCKFYDKKQGCKKKITVRECVKKGLKNKE